MSRRSRQPVVSVLLPCRDAAPWLPACIASLERQTLDSFEVLAVDDGSTDVTREMLTAWAARDRRVLVLETGGAGLVATLRLAAERATAPCLARMDADDIAHRDRLAAQVAFLDERPEIAACGTGVRLFPRGELGSGYRRYERWLNGIRTPEEVARDLYVECPLAHPALMLRRSAFRRVGGYRDPGWPEDYDLVLRLHACGFRMANLPRRLLGWRVRADRLSRRSTSYTPEAFRRCKVAHLSAELPRERPLVVWGAGRVGKAFARTLAGAGREPAAFVDLDPRKIGQRIHGAPVLDPAGLEARLDGDPVAAYVLVAVGSPGAREEIRRTLASLGPREPEDFRTVA